MSSGKIELFWLFQNRSPGDLQNRVQRYEKNLIYANFERGKVQGREPRIEAMDEGTDGFEAGAGGEF